MPYTYKSGEIVSPGDRVLLHGNPGNIEFVADADEKPDDWYVKEFGGGFMVVEPKVFGRLFLTPQDEDYFHLEFLSRGKDTAGLEEHS